MQINIPLNMQLMMLYLCILKCFSKNMIKYVNIDVYYNALLYLCI